MMKKKSLDFARGHRHWTLAECKKVLFSDECTMQQFVHAICTSGGHWVSVFVVATMKHPPNQMVWGVMSCRGPKCVKLLKAKLKLHMHVHDCTVFIQDSAACHRSKVATEFMKKNKIFFLLE